GGVATSSSVIADIVNIAFLNTAFIRKNTNIPIKNIRDIVTRYYIRFIAADFPGVLAKISKILASLNISIASVNQKERKEKGVVPVVMLTHQAKEDNVRKAIASIDRLKVVKSPTQIIRIEDL
ncbi:MAG: ACT domain-containing protein, partial [Omnitrophica bacterium]|nr:ACT domain-containing protein [Candidatus Omnitrophota bacterium]